MKKHVVITDRFSKDSLVFLESQPNLAVESISTPTHIPVESLIKAHALIIRSRTRITEEILKKAQNLQVIISSTSGFDHIDLDMTKKWGITVMHTPSANTESAAQLTLGHIISLAHNLVRGHQQVKTGSWHKERIVGIELHGRTLGIVGLGRIGSRVAELGKCFGMNVVAFDPYQSDEVFHRLQLVRNSYEEVLKLADVVSFHVPKTSETINMLNRSHFEYIHRGIIIVNTSRGHVINEADLVHALKSGWLKGVGLDVFEKEPLSTQSNLLQFENVIFSPHIGANTEDAFYKASQLAAMKLVRFFADGSTSDTLPPKAEWYGAVAFPKD